MFVLRLFIINKNQTIKLQNEKSIKCQYLFIVNSNIL